MFESCRFCHRPTDRWRDFCDECAERETLPPMRPTHMKVIQGGKDGWERPGREPSRPAPHWLRAVVSPSSEPDA